MSAPDFDVAIIGAGFSGLGAAIKLKDQGIDNIVVLEKTGRVGGTWRDNRYPGAACDIPSELYSFSFAPAKHWPRAYSSADDILSYIDDLVARFDLAPLIRFNHAVQGLRFDDQNQVWHLTTKQGEALTARSVIIASGPFTGGKVPAFEGLDGYQGHMIHSADWDHSYDMTGKRVGVIGTGASAVQIIPELVKSAERVTVFQRTPGWVLPKRNPKTPDWMTDKTSKAVREALFWAHEAMATGIVWTSPVTRVLEHLSRRYLKRTVKDPWLRRQLTPDYRIGCKRVLMTSDYYPALTKDNCRLVTWPITRFSDTGIVTAAGLEYELDCVVFATGFEVGHSAPAYTVTGANGRQLADDWNAGAHAFKSVTVAGYPNLFWTFGPNSGPGHNSAMVYVEAQLDYIAQALTTMRDQAITSLNARSDRQQSYNAELQARLKKTNWASGCKSWYLTEEGFNATMYPGFATQYCKQLERFDLNDFQIASATTPASQTAPREPAQA